MAINEIVNVCVIGGISSRLQHYYRTQSWLSKPAGGCFESEAFFALNYANECPLQTAKSCTISSRSQWQKMRKS